MAEEFAQIHYVGKHLERPPRVRLYFDVLLTNTQSEPRWFLLPDKIRAEESKTTYAVDSVDVYRLGDRGQVIVGHFRGSAGFQTLCLPTDAKVMLRRFPVLFLGRVPASVTLEVITAVELTVGGEPAAFWFGMDPSSAGKADVEAGPMADQRAVQHVKRTDDFKEVSVEVIGHVTRLFESRLA